MVGEMDFPSRASLSIKRHFVHHQDHSALFAGRVHVYAIPLSTYSSTANWEVFYAGP